MKINLNNIVFFASIGFFEYEHVVKTKILISIEIEYTNQNDFSKIENIINYDSIFEIISQIIKSKHFKFIEDLAFEIGKKIKEYSNLVGGGMVKVQKCIKGNVLQEISCQNSF